MAELLVRTWPSAATPGAVAGVRFRRESGLLIGVRGPAPDGAHEVYDGEAGLCVLIGHVAGTLGAEGVLERWLAGGPAAVARLDGQFVVLLHDRRSGRTCVLRDRVGFGHAYYWARGDRFGLSTSLPWLVRDAAGSGGPAPRPSARGLALYLTYQYVPAPDSIVDGVRQLGAGEAVSIGDAGFEVVGAAAFPAPSDGHAEPVGSLPAHGERVVELIAEAAADRLRGAGNVGVLMSGGLDTSTNAVVLVRRLGIRPTAFTATFDEEFYDESAFAASVAAHLGLEHVRVPIRPELVVALPEVARAFDTPNADQAAFAEHFLAGAAREHGCRLVVTGEGGDEVLGLPQSHHDDVDFGRLPDGPGELARFYLGRTELADAALREVLFAGLEVPAEVAVEPLERIYRGYSDRPAFERVLYGQWRTWMADGVFMKDSRVFRAGGVTAVLPMMSPALMEYVAALPLPTKLAGLADKAFLRAAVGPRLPPEILTRGKHKFWLPFADWFRGPVRDFLRDQLLSDGFVSDVFGKGLVQCLVDEHESGDSDHSRVLWALLFLELWWAGLTDPAEPGSSLVG